MQDNNFILRNNLASNLILTLSHLFRVSENWKTFNMLIAVFRLCHSHAQNGTTRRDAEGIPKGVIGLNKCQFAIPKICVAYNFHVGCVTYAQIQVQHMCGQMSVILFGTSDVSR